MHTMATLTTLDPRTSRRRAAKNRDATLAPFEAMTDRELIRAYHHGDRRSAFTVIMDRINARGISIDYDGHDDGQEAAVAAFAKAGA